MRQAIALFILRWRRRLAASRIQSARAYAEQQRASAAYAEQHLIPRLESEAAQLNGLLFAAEYPVRHRWAGKENA